MNGRQTSDGTLAVSISYSAVRRTGQHKRLNGVFHCISKLDVRFIRLVILTIAGVVMALILTAAAPRSVTAQPAEEYRLGINDRVNVKIGRWRAAEGVYENWEGLEGEYIVGPNGKLFIALAGSIPAEGRIVSEVAEEISRRVQRRIGIPTAPFTSIEIVEFRPIYVVGAVNNPGEFRYRPEMTVLQAVGLAGGHLRFGGNLLRPERETLTAVRDYEVLKLRRWGLIARLARIAAALADKQKIEMPEELAKSPKATELLRNEEAILVAQLEAVKSKKLAIKELRQLLKATIKKLDKEIKLRDRQLKLAREELKRLESLVQRGLAITSRETDFGRAVTDLEAKQLQLEVAKLSAEQQLNEAFRDELDLVNENLKVNVSELQETREELDQVELQLQTAKSLILEAVSLGSGLTSPQDVEKPIYRLTRSIGGETTTLIVGEQHSMMPGDTLQVIAPKALPSLDSGGSSNLPG